MDKHFYLLRLQAHLFRRTFFFTLKKRKNIDPTTSFLLYFDFYANDSSYECKFRFFFLSFFFADNRQRLPSLPCVTGKSCTKAK